jgi:hypothetical protein
MKTAGCMLRFPHARSHWAIPTSLQNRVRHPAHPLAAGSWLGAGPAGFAACFLPCWHQTSSSRRARHAYCGVGGNPRRDRDHPSSGTCHLTLRAFIIAAEGACHPWTSTRPGLIARPNGPPLTVGRRGVLPRLCCARLALCVGDDNFAVIQKKMS